MSRGRSPGLKQVRAATDRRRLERPRTGMTGVRPRGDSESCARADFVLCDSLRAVRVLCSRT